jgi:hypothetical protein
VRRGRSPGFRRSIEARAPAEGRAFGLCGSAAAPGRDARSLRSPCSPISARSRRCRRVRRAARGAGALQTPPALEATAWVRSGPRAPRSPRRRGGGRALRRRAPLARAPHGPLGRGPGDARRLRSAPRLCLRLGAAGRGRGAGPRAAPGRGGDRRERARVGRAQRRGDAREGEPLRGRRRRGPALRHRLVRRLERGPPGPRDGERPRVGAAAAAAGRAAPPRRHAVRRGLGRRDARPPHRRPRHTLRPELDGFLPASPSTRAPTADDRAPRERGRVHVPAGGGPLGGRPVRSRSAGRAAAAGPSSARSPPPASASQRRGDAADLDLPLRAPPPRYWPTRSASRARCAARVDDGALPLGAARR